MKKVLSLFLSLVLMISMVPAATATGFADVDGAAWYADAVDYVVSNGLMGGYGDGKFGANDGLSRAMIAQILYNKEGQPAISGMSNFSDVPADQWFYNAVTWGTQKGVMGGYGDGKFGPNDNVTLEQIAVILWNYSGNPAASGDLSGVGKYSDWAANALKWCVSENLFDKIPSTAATDSATRAQTAQILTNYLTTQDAGITKITDHGYILSVPTQYVDKLIIDGWEEDPAYEWISLFTVSQKSSDEAAKKHYGPDASGGFLFNLYRIDANADLEDYTSVDTVFARDDQGNFFLCSWPGDVSFFAFDKDGKFVDGYSYPLPDIPEVDDFMALSAWSLGVLYSFIEDNGLTPYFLHSTEFGEVFYQLIHGTQTVELKNSSGEQLQSKGLPTLNTLPAGTDFDYATHLNPVVSGPYITVRAPGWFEDCTYDFFIGEGFQHIVRVNTPASKWQEAQTDYYFALHNNANYPVGKELLSCWDALTGKAADSNVTGISLDITSHKMGEDWTQYLTATLSPAGAKDTITWTSSNPKVATVNEKGKVSGVSGGTTTITARTSNGKTATCTIEVWHSHKLTRTTPATCTGAGNEVYTCAFCGHSYDKYLPPLGGNHTWTSGSCSKCHASMNDYSAVRPVTNTGYPTYDMLLAEYSFAMSLPTNRVESFSDLCERQGNRLHFYPSLVTSLLEYNSKMYYALYDIDGNRVPELLIGDSYADDICIFALNPIDEVVYVAEGGGRHPCYVLTNGRVLTTGNTSVFSSYYVLRQLLSNGMTTEIESYYFDSSPDPYYESGMKLISENAFFSRLDKLMANSVMSKIKWIPLP